MFSVCIYIYFQTELSSKGGVVHNEDIVQLLACSCRGKTKIQAIRVDITKKRDFPLT